MFATGRQIGSKSACNGRAVHSGNTALCPTPARVHNQERCRSRDPRRGRGLPRLPASPFQRAAPITPADRMAACVDCFAIRAAFPEIQPGRHPHHYFRGLLRPHTRCGPLDRSTAQGGLNHEASARPIARPNRSLATRTIDNSLDRTSLHW
jgi:hypothetical protein